MPIRFACPTCGAALVVSSKMSGTVMACTSCKQPLQVPQAPPRPAGARRQAGGKKPGPVITVRPRESMRAFWALCRLSLWGLCFAAVVLTLASYATELSKDLQPDKEMLLNFKTLVWLFGAYYVARTFDDSSKSLEELIARVRRKKPAAAPAPAGQRSA